MALWQWSTTAANNATADPSINWQEGQAPSTVNDSARAMMAAIAAWFQTPEWLNLGDVPTYVSATQFTVPGNLTSRYPIGRRVRASVTAGTVYGTITGSAYTSLTTVTVALDSGSLDSGLSEVDVGMLNPAASSVPNLPSLTVTGSVVNIGGASLNSEIDAILTNSNTSGALYLNASGVMGFYDRTRGAVRWSSDTFANFNVVGNLSAGGTITGSNITASSDERLKTDWENLPHDFIERLAAVTSGTYTHIDTGNRHVGVGAQSLRHLMPEAIVESDKGFLSVAYGQAALVACVELAKEVVRLRALLEPLK